MKCRKIVVEVQHRMEQGEKIENIEVLNEFDSESLKEEIIQAAMLRLRALKAHEGEKDKEIREEQAEVPEFNPDIYKFPLTEFELSYIDLVNSILERLDKKEYKVDFYSNPKEIKSAGFRQGEIIFRREAFDQKEGLKMLNQIRAGKMDEEIHEWLFGPDGQIQLIVHELVHLIFMGSERWSHGADPRIDRSFAHHMREIIQDLIRSGFS